MNIFFLEIHSGDTDAVLPLTATRYSINALNLQVNTSWYAWYDKKKVNKIKSRYIIFLKLVINE